MVTIRKIIEENFDAIIKMKRPEGENFVASNAVSLAQAWLYRDDGDVFPFAEYFCYRISNEGFEKVQFSFDVVTNVPRIILTGKTADVLRLVNGYFQEYPLD